MNIFTHTRPRHLPDTRAMGRKHRNADPSCAPAAHVKAEEQVRAREGGMFCGSAHALCHAAARHAAPRRAAPRRTTPHHAAPRRITSHHATPCCATPNNSRHPSLCLLAGYW
eukprot:6341905-Prymnesium_polylepis.1